MYFDSFGIEYIPQKVLSKIKDKPITDNIFRIQGDDSIMCGLTLLGCTNLFSPNDYKKNDKIIYKYFQDKYCKSKRRP